MNNTKTTSINSFNLLEFLDQFKYHIYLYLILTTDFYLMYKSIGPFPPRNYIVAALTLILIPENIKLYKAHGYKILLLPIIVLFMNIYAIIINQYILHNDIHHYLKNIIKYVPIALSIIPIAYNLSLKQIAKIIVVVMSVTIIIAFFQTLNIDFFWKIRELIDPRTYFEIAHGQRPRPVGLAYYTLTLVEHILISLPYILLLFTRYKNKYYIKSVLTILLLVTVLSGNRGLQAGSILVILFFFKKQVLTFLLSKIKKIGIAILLVTIISLFAYYITIMLEHKNDGSRLYILIASLIHIKNNFIIGTGPNLMGIADNLSTDFLLQFKHEPGFKKAYEIAPHNFFVNIQLQFGILGTIAIITIYYNLLKKTVLNRKTQQLIILPTIVAISFNSLFHNAGFLNTSSLFISLCLMWTFLYKKEENLI